MVKPYICFQSQGHVKQNLTEHTYCLLSCRDNSTLNFPLCQATATLHQGQGHRYQYDHYMPCISLYRHAQFVRDITIKLQVKKKCHV